MITLTLKEQPSVPLEAEVLSPDVTVELSNAAIRALPVYLGKRQRRVEDFFDVDGASSDQITIQGDASRVKWIGRAMTRGQITVTGNAGMNSAIQNPTSIQLAIGRLVRAISQAKTTPATSPIACRTNESVSVLTMASSMTTLIC